MSFLNRKNQYKKQQDEQTAWVLSKDGIMKSTMLSYVGAWGRRKASNTDYFLFKILEFFFHQGFLYDGDF